MAATGRDYIPGVCNIGRAEIQQRKLIGWIGLVGTIALWAFFAFAKISPVARLWVAGPALLSAIGFLQAGWGFCVKYGFGGVFSFGPKVGETETVDQAEFRRKDRRTSLLIVGLAFLIAGLVGAAAYWIPI